LKPYHFLNKIFSRIIEPGNGSLVKLFLIPIAIAIFVLASQFGGGLQLLEWKLFDQFVQWRPAESVDSRIVIVTFNEEDISKIGKWPFADNVVAKLLKTIRTENPRVIGLDVYRNLPVEPGYAELKEVLRTTPSLIMPEKIVNPPVPAPLSMTNGNQVGFVDVVVDNDGTLRRGLLSVEKPGGKVVYGFGLKIALKYLEPEGIVPQQEAESRAKVSLGKIQVLPFESFQGGYAATDTGGYQTLINYRCAFSCFKTVSLTKVLDNTYPKGLFEDRIVLIGSAAESLRDYFLSPYGKMPGVFVHANLVSQLVNGALDGRPFLQIYPKWMEGLWVLFCSLVGATGIWYFLHGNGLSKTKFVVGIFAFLPLSVVGLIGISYLSYLFSFWLPILPSITSFLLSSIICIIYLSEQLRYVSNIDELTQIANRRYFERILLQNFRKKKDLSIIICDVDFFKLYNDTYGHQAGDKCLKKVATTIANAVRNRDLAARYGGEEFAIILPLTSYQVAMRVAERIIEDTRALKIPHASSKAGDYVTLSCGVASVVADGDFPSLDLLVKADRALYKAKESGRNQVVGDQS
jgi:adenylate cyclase